MQDFNLLVPVSHPQVPLSTTRMGATCWSEVTCEDGRVYWFNNESEEASWSLPPEVAEVKKEQEAEAARRWDIGCCGVCFFYFIRTLHSISVKRHVRRHAGVVYGWSF